MGSFFSAVFRSKIKNPPFRADILSVCSVSKVSFGMLYFSEQKKTWKKTVYFLHITIDKQGNVWYNELDKYIFGFYGKVYISEFLNGRNHGSGKTMH